MMHDTICAIIQLFVTYQQKFCQLYPVSVYRGVTRSVHSEFAVCGSSLLSVHGGGGGGCYGIWDLGFEGLKILGFGI